MSFLDLFDLGKRAVELGIDGWTYWQKANAAIDQQTGAVNPDAYAALVAETDALIAAIKRDAEEARRA